jgi:hypothetical protein
MKTSEGPFLFDSSEGVAQDDLATVTRVLSIGTDRLNSLLNKGKKS